MLIIIAVKSSRCLPCVGLKHLVVNVIGIVDLSQRCNSTRLPTSSVSDAMRFLRLFLSDGQKLTKKLPTKSLTNFFLVRPV